MSESAADKLKHIAKREIGKRRQATPDFAQRMRAFHEGLIDDDRVTCQECGKWGLNGFNRVACAENLSSMPDLPRRCIRWIKKKGEL